MFAITIAILVYSIADAHGFRLIWRYFAWANQLLATVTLWTIAVCFVIKKGGRWYLISLIPALFMTMVTGCFLFVAKGADGGLGDWIPRYLGYIIGAAITIANLILFIVWKKKFERGETKYEKGEEWGFEK